MTFSILLNIVGQDLVEFQNLPLLSEAEGHKKVVLLSNQTLPSNMGRWLLGFSVLSAALLATTFAYQETKRSTARDAWRMEDNQEERRKEVKGDKPSNENQENSVMHNVSRREGIFSTRNDEPTRKVYSKRTESTPHIHT